jgi:hypothetical protein
VEVDPRLFRNSWLAINQKHHGRLRSKIAFGFATPSGQEGNTSSKFQHHADYLLLLGHQCHLYSIVDVEIGLGGRLDSRGIQLVVIVR